MIITYYRTIIGSLDVISRYIKRVMNPLKHLLKRSLLLYITYSVISRTKYSIDTSIYNPVKLSPSYSPVQVKAICKFCGVDNGTIARQIINPRAATLLNKPKKISVRSDNTAWRIVLDNR